jgi:hypothetical protein
MYKMWNKINCMLILNDDKICVKYVKQDWNILRGILNGSVFREIIFYINLNNEF